MVALWFAFIVSVLAGLYVISWTFFPDLEPDIFRQFNAWYVKEMAGFGLKDLLVVMFLVLDWVMLSMRDLLREIHEELKSVRADLTRLGNSN